MATEHAVYDVGDVTSDADLSAKQFYAVLASTTNDHAVKLTTTQGAPIFGVLQNKPTTSQAAVVRRLGRTKMVALTTITRGDQVMADSTGKAMTLATTGSTSIGWAMESGVANQLIEVDLIPYAGTK